MAPLVTDQIDIAINMSTWDIPATGNLTMTSGIAAVQQGAMIRLKMFAGEWMLNLAQGVPWIARPDGSVTAADAILGSKFNQAKAERAFRDQLLGNAAKGITGVPGIVALPVLTASYDNPTRTLTVNWKATTVFGDTNLNTFAIPVINPGVGS